tara:strand:- start:1778 stop:1888 length:111 start_codon:yes stop_codon:yes gene_type:complete
VTVTGGAASRFEEKLSVLNVGAHLRLFNSASIRREG